MTKSTPVSRLFVDCHLLPQNLSESDGGDGAVMADEYGILKDAY